MRKFISLRAAGLVLAAVGVTGAGATATAATTASTTIATTTTTAAAPAPARAGATKTVEIRSGSCPGTVYCFSPASVTVTVGETVRWTDTSGSDHTVTRCDPASCSGNGGGSGTDGSFTRGDVGGSREFTHTFSAPGTYVYFCEFHGYATMHGMVTVRAAVTTTTAAPSGPATTSPPGATSPTGEKTPGTGTAAAGPRLAGTGTTSRLLVVGSVLVGTGALLALARRPRRRDSAR